MRKERREKRKSRFTEEDDGTIKMNRAESSYFCLNEQFLNVWSDVGNHYDYTIYYIEEDSFPAFQEKFKEIAKLYTRPIKFFKIDKSNAYVNLSEYHTDYTSFIFLIEEIQHYYVFGGGSWYVPYIQNKDQYFFYPSHEWDPCFSLDVAECYFCSGYTLEVLKNVQRRIRNKLAVKNSILLKNEVTEKSYFTNLNEVSLFQLVRDYIH